MDNKWVKPNDYTKEEATIEANRCLSCKTPLCQTGCPTHMRIRDFIKEIKNDNLDAARKIIDGCSSLSNICSIVCPHENQCVGHCVMNRMKVPKPINVGALERYVQNNTKDKIEKKNIINVSVAVIGAGPAGLACSKELLASGAHVEIFEREAVAGGVMTYGIPSYRLDYADVLKNVKDVEDLGGIFHYECKMMESDILELKNKFDYVFIATGLTKVRHLGIPNDNISGVYDALDFLTNVNYAIKLNKGQLPKLYGTAVIVGAGNVAMDAARSAVRLGCSKVIVAYRRSREEAPATKHEISDAEREGVEFNFLLNPVEVIGNDCVEGVKCEIMRLAEADESGRRKPVGTNEFKTIPCDFIISAIGQIPENIYNSNVIKTDHSYICAGDDLSTNVNGIYTGGDVTLGAKTVVLAMDCGRRFAKMVIEENTK